jgi:hypothetical protein
VATTDHSDHDDNDSKHSISTNRAARNKANRSYVKSEGEQDEDDENADADADVDRPTKRVKKEPSYELSV